MDIENSIKRFLSREDIPFEEHQPHPTVKVLTCTIDGDLYNFKIFEDRNVFSIKAFTATDEVALWDKAKEQLNTLNQTMFGTFSWYETKGWIHVFTCEFEHPCAGGITANEQLIEDVAVEVHKGIKAIENLLKI